MHLQDFNIHFLWLHFRRLSFYLSEHCVYWNFSVLKSLNDDRNHVQLLITFNLFSLFLMCQVFIVKNAYKYFYSSDEIFASLRRTLIVIKCTWNILSLKQCAYSFICVRTILFIYRQNIIFMLKCPFSANLKLL